MYNKANGGHSAMDDMIIKRINALCAARGWSYYRLAKESDIPYSTLNTTLNKMNAPSLWTLKKICDGFDITLAQFFDEQEDRPVTREQYEHLLLWEKLDEQSKALARAYIEGLLSRQMYSSPIEAPINAAP